MVFWTDWLAPVLVPSVTVLATCAIIWLYRRISLRREREYLISQFTKHTGISETEWRRLVNEGHKSKGRGGF